MGGGGETLALLLIGSLSPRQHPDAKASTPVAAGKQRRRWGGLRVRAGVPEVGGGGPLQGQAGHVHGGVHQQEEDGHDAGDGVELPGEEDQLVGDRDSWGGGWNEIVNAVGDTFKTRRRAQSWGGRGEEVQSKCPNYCQRDRKLNI